MTYCIKCGKPVEGTDHWDYTLTGHPAEKFCVTHWDELVEKTQTGTYIREDEFHRRVEQAMKEALSS